MKFITILSWVFLFLFLIRILGVLFSKRSAQEELIIEYQEKLGNYLIYKELKVPIIGFIVCLCWLFSIYL